MGFRWKELDFDFDGRFDAVVFFQAYRQFEAYELYCFVFCRWVLCSLLVRRTRWVVWKVYLVAIVVKCYFWPMEEMQKPGDISLIHFTPNFISTFPVQVFAFTCSQNVSFAELGIFCQWMTFLKFFPLYNEVVSNTQERMNVIIGGSIGSAIITYEVIAVFGYLTFGSKV